jgi:hypothetical protein
MWSLTQLYGHYHDGAMTCFHGIGNALRHMAGLQPISYEQNLLLACKRNRSSKATIARLIRCASARGLENWRGPSVKGGIESVRQQGGRIGSLVANPGAASSETGIGVNMQGKQMLTMADLGSHRGGKKAGSRAEGRSLGSRNVERARESKQPAAKQLAAANAKSHEMSPTDLLAQLKKVTEEKQKEHGGVTGAFSKFFLFLPFALVVVLEMILND